MTIPNQPFYLDTNGCTPGGSQLELHYKCILFDDGAATWELRRLLDSLVYENPNAVKYFRGIKLPQLDLALRRLDMPPDYMVVPSQRALQGLPAPPKYERYILDEFCLDTKGLLYIFPFCWRSRPPRQAVRQL